MTATTTSTEAQNRICANPDCERPVHLPGLCRKCANMASGYRAK